MIHLHKCRWIMKKRWQSNDRVHLVEVCAVEGGGTVVVWSRPDAMDVRAYRSPRAADEKAAALMAWISDRNAGVGWTHSSIT